MSIILTTSNFIFPLITYSYVARVLGTVGTGKVAFVNSILSYFLYIAILGIPGYGLRECAKIRDDKEKLSHLVQELLIINLISTAIAYACLTAAVLSVPKLESYKALFVIMGVYIFLNTIGLEWVYNALEEYRYITIRSITFKIISVVLTFLLIRSESDYLFYGFLTIFTMSASYILNFINLRKYVSLKKKAKYNLKRHLKPIMFFFSASIIITLYSNFDVSMLGFIGTEEQVGLYYAALKIKAMILSLSTAVTAVIVPRMSYYIKNGNKELAKNLTEKSLRVSFLLAIPIALYVVVFAENCIAFLCGSEFLPVANTLRVLMVCIVPLVMSNLFGNQILIPLGDEKRYSLSVFVGMWINIILNAIMIPFWGAFGAAIGTLVTESWNVLCMSGGLAKEYRMYIFSRITLWKYFVPLILATVISFIVGRFISGVYVIVQLALTGSVFFIVYYVSLLIIKEPILMQVCDKMKRRFKDE